MNEKVEVFLSITYCEVIESVKVFHELVDLVELERSLFHDFATSNIMIVKNTVKKPYFQLLTTKVTNRKKKDTFRRRLRLQRNRVNFYAKNDLKFS